MRKSSIQVMRMSRKNSLDHVTSLNQQNNFQIFPKTQFGQRLTVKDLTRVATQKILTKMQQEKAQCDPVTTIWTEPQIRQVKKLNIPQYEFLKRKEQIKTDPFLKAKMKYLVTKERPELLKQMQAVKPSYSVKRNGKNLENDFESYTTLRKEQRKQNNRKLYLLTVGNSTKK